MSLDAVNGVVTFDPRAVRAKAAVRFVVTVEIPGLLAPQEQEMEAEFEGTLVELRAWTDEVCAALDRVGAQKATGG